MAKPAHYTSKVAIPLPSDEAVRRIMGNSFNPEKTLNVIKMFAGTEDLYEATVGLDPASGSLVEGGVEAQTRRVMQNLAAVLKAAGSSLGRVVKTTVFVADLGDFATINDVYATYFPEQPPARSTVQVAGLPAGALVEIEAIALV